MANKTAAANIENSVLWSYSIWFYALAFAMFVVPNIVTWANTLEASAFAKVNIIIKSDWARLFIASTFFCNCIVELFAFAFLRIWSP